MMSATAYLVNAVSRHKCRGMRVNDQLAICIILFTLACEGIPDYAGNSESTADETDTPTLDRGHTETASTSCDVDISGGFDVSCSASKPGAGKMYGPCTVKHECADDLVCQVADDPDPQLPKGTICLPTCWGEGHDNTCPEALDGCGEPFAETTCQSATDPLRAVPCILPCASDEDCPADIRCWIDRCVYEGL